MTPAAKRPGRSRLRWVAAGVLDPRRRRHRRRGDPAAHRQLGRPVGPRLDARRLRRLHRAPARPARATSAPSSPRSCRPSRASTTRPRSRPSSTRRSTSSSPTRRDGEQSWTTDIEPWFGGQLAAERRRPADQRGRRRGSTRALVLVGVKDAAKAKAWADALAAKDGATTATETYNGVTITTITPPAGASDMAKGLKAGYAVIGPVLALGDVDSVKAAIDTNGKTGLATDEQFKAASATPDRRPPRLRLRRQRRRSARRPRTWSAPWRATLPRCPPCSTRGWPPGPPSRSAPRTAPSSSSRARPHVDAGGPAKNSESKLPSLVPPTTVAFAEGHDVGEQVTRIKELIASDPQLADGLKQVEDTLALIGGLDADHRLDGRGRRRGHRGRRLDRRRRRRDPDRRGRGRAPVRPARGLHPARRRLAGPQGHRGGLRRHDDHDPRPRRPRRHARRVGRPARVRPGEPADRVRRDRRGRGARHDRLREGRARRPRPARPSRTRPASRPRSTARARATRRSPGWTSRASSASPRPT